MQKGDVGTWTSGINGGKMQGFDLRHILERESTGFADGLNKGLEEKGFRIDRDSGTEQ